MLRGSIAALAHPIFTATETLQLIRDILAQQLASSPGPKQVSQVPGMGTCTRHAHCLSNPAYYRAAAAAAAELPWSDWTVLYAGSQAFRSLSLCNQCLYAFAMF